MCVYQIYDWERRREGAECDMRGRRINLIPSIPLAAARLLIIPVSIMFDFPWKVLIFFFVSPPLHTAWCRLTFRRRKSSHMLDTNLIMHFFFRCPISSIFYLCQKQFKRFKQRFSLHQLRRMSSCLSLDDISIDALRWNAKNGYRYEHFRQQALWFGDMEWLHGHEDTPYSRTFHSNGKSC